MNRQEFNSIFQLANFDKLEDAFQQALLFFKSLKGKEIKFGDVGNRFPAFCTDISGDNKIKMLLLKYPTYKVVAFDCTESKVKDLLKDFVGNISIYTFFSECLITGSFVAVAIDCREIVLGKNEKLADNLKEILENNNIRTERWAEEACVYFRIQVDDDGYISLINSENK